MKMNLKKTLILSILLLAHFSLFSQEITEENFLKEDKLIWDEYELKMQPINNCFNEHPEKIDSLMAVAYKIDEESNKRNCEIAIKYATIPIGLKRLYMVRLEISKDTLNSVFKRLPTEIQESNYGKSILLHINSNQIEEGDDFYDFQATTSNGDLFKLSQLEGKNILLIYGGLSCMRKSGRDFLKKYYETINSNNFNIVVFNHCSNVEELEKMKTKYNLDFIFVSDFKNDHSPMKIIYGAQSTPTCFLINKDGKIIIKSIGLPEEQLKKLKAKMI